MTAHPRECPPGLRCGGRFQVLAWVLGVLVGCTAAPPTAAAQPFDADAAERLKAGLPPLSRSLSAETRAVAETYRQHYDLAFDNASWHIGTVYAAGYRIAAQLFIPKRSPRALAVLLHGYLDHAGLNRHAVHALLESGCAVVAFDMPGHGLSSGARGDIGDFREYSDVLHRVLATSRLHLEAAEAERGGDPAKPLPLVGVGHSTGAAALLEHLEHYETNYDALVFVAPLVRIRLWPLSQAGIRLGAPLIETVARRIDAASSNPEYIEFSTARDPLGVYRVPLSWAETYLDWEQRTHSYHSTHTTPLLVLQAEHDSVVDNDYNRAYLHNRFEHVSMLTIAETRHSLLNEPADRRRKVFAAIQAFLDIVDLEKYKSR